MTFRLIHKYGSKDSPQFRGEDFQTEPEAVIAACARIAAGEQGEFETRDHLDNVVVDDVEIRNRCKVTRMP